MTGSNEPYMPQALPNIVVFFADNLGYADVGAFGSPAAVTPNIDRLAAEGVRLTNWNSGEALCSPSRAALLTGRLAVRTGVFPHTFRLDASRGLPANETTMAEYLRDAGYRTGMLGKWHLGQRPRYLPTRRGFDEYVGVPYSMDMGSLDGHGRHCAYDVNSSLWLPLLHNETIVEQPVVVETLTPRYASFARAFMQRWAHRKPFFLYVAFSHVHQLCAPGRGQWASPAFANSSGVSPFEDAVAEMDWLTGQVMEAQAVLRLDMSTLTLWTSDNGPWTAEQQQAGSTGPFQASWFREHAPVGCYACPGGYVHSPTAARPARCICTATAAVAVAGSAIVGDVDGVACGDDVGLGSTWEVNLRLPAIARWPKRIRSGSASRELVSTLDVLPTVLALARVEPPPTRTFDGIDISTILFTAQEDGHRQSFGPSPDRPLFFWRDGGATAPAEWVTQASPAVPPAHAPQLFAVKIGRYKAHLQTKSATGSDAAVVHDPPLLFDVLADPAEQFPLDVLQHTVLVRQVKTAAQTHMQSIEWAQPLTIETDYRYAICANASNACRL